MANEREYPPFPDDAAAPPGGMLPPSGGYPKPQSGFTLDRVIRWILGGTVVLVTIWLLWYFASLVVFLVIGVLLAYVMRPVVDRLQGLGAGRIGAILITFILVFGALILGITKLAPFAGTQISEISRKISFQRAAQITAVDSDGPGAAAGLRAGDLVVSVEGQPWDGFTQVQTIIQNKLPGDSLRLHLDNEEEGTTRRVLLLGLPPRSEELQPVVTDDEDEQYFPTLGVTFQEVTLSNVAVAIEERVRRVLPIERGRIVRGIAVAVQQIFGEDQLTRLFGSVVGIFTNLFYAVLVIPFVAFFFLKDGMSIRHSFLRLVPNRYFEPTLALMEKIEINIGRYLRALFLQALSVATVASILLYIVGLDYAIAVGIFTGLANTIPYFGPLMGVLAGALAGVVQTGDFSLLPGVVIAMALTQVSDNVIFQPFIFSRAARTHPLMILFGVLIGAQLGGIVGMLIAIPVLTIIRVTIEQLLWSLRNYRILRTA